MSSKNWQQIEQAYHSALDLPPDARAAHLAKVFPGDEASRKEVESLLSQDASSPGLLLNQSPVAFPPSSPLAPGTPLGPYRIEGPLGAGGMGEVWKALDTRLHREVAIKLVRTEDAADAQADARLWQEARAAAQVSHPNLCQLFDVIDDGCRVYLVMELLEGRPLAARIAEGPMPPCEANLTISAVLVALGVLHDHRLVHRDLKPSNVFLTPAGVKVLDFGLAARHRLNDPALAPGDQTLTQTVDFPGLIAGTPPYMAPERIQGAAPAPSADLFAAGCLFYEMLTARKAFGGDTMSEVIQNLMHGGPAAEDLPPDSRRFWPVIERALARKPQDRYASAADMREAVEQHATRQMTQARRRFAPSPYIAAAVLLVALLAGGVWVAARRGWLGVRAPAAEAVNARSIAVLPVANRTGDPSLDYIADGTTTNIIRQLSALPGLRVISKNSVQRFAATADPRKTAAELGVGHILAGSIRREGVNFNMDFELSRGADGSVLLSRQYRPDSPDLLSTQATVVVDIVQSLAMTLTREEQKKLGERPTVNNEAWDNFLRAEHLADLMDPASLNGSLTLFQKAVDKDPAFALAMSQYASSHLKLGIFFDDPREHFPIAKQWAVRALSIDDSLADAHGVLGLVALLYDWDYSEAERQLLLGSGRMNPAALRNLSCSSHLMESTGRGRRADEELHTALLTDPLSATIQSELGCNCYYSRLYDRAIREYQKALLLRANDLNSLWGLGRSYAQKKMFADAESALKAAKLPDGSMPPIILSELGYVYGSSGRSREAHGVIQQMDTLRGKMFVDPFLQSVIHLSMGELNETFARLDDAYKVRSAFLVSLKSDPKWDRVHGDPRFQAMMQKVGFGAQSQ